MVKEETKINSKGRNVILSIAKKDKETDWWPRLTQEEGKNPNIHVDFSKWKDQDDSEDSAADPVDNMDFDHMGGDYQEDDSEDNDEVFAPMPRDSNDEIGFD